MPSTEKPESKRQLAAILFADIVGYTSMMQIDEGLALQKINRYQDLLDTAAKTFNGQVLKNYGDGSLMTFSNSVDAVQAAKQIQEQAKLAIVVPLRIGIHVGEFVVEKGDIYGNGVNLASRIESLGIQGTVLFSKNVFQKIKNQPDLVAHALGSFEFKNVEEPMEVFALTNEGFPIPRREALQGKLKESPKSKSNTRKLMVIAGVIGLLLFAGYKWISNRSSLYNLKDSTAAQVNASIHSIAVLPLINLNANIGEQEIFSDGVTQEIIDELAKVKDLTVSAFTATYMYKNHKTSLKEIANELESNLIMSGTSRIFSNGDSVRLSLELVNPLSQKRIWNGVFNETMDNAPQIQSAIAKEVASKLNIKLSPSEKEAIDKPTTTSGEAFKLFLLAKSEINKFTIEGFTAGRRYLNTAIELDPKYIQAYTLLAWSYAVGGSADVTAPAISSRESVAFAEPFIEQSLKLDSLNSNIYLVRGNVNVYLKNQIRDAKKDVDRAIEINSWPQVPINFCMCTVVSVYMALGDLEKAKEVAKLAKKVDPGNLLLDWDDGNLAMLEGNYEKAQQHYQIAVDKADLPVFTSFLGMSHYHGGNYDTALKVLLKTYNQNEVSIGANLAYLSNTYLKLDDRAKADVYFQELLNRNAAGESHLDYYIATTYMARNEIDLALRHLELALENDDWGIAVNSSIDPIFKPLHNHPRFIEFRRQMQYYN